jgi:hypothetical protein
MEYVVSNLNKTKKDTSKLQHRKVHKTTARVGKDAHFENSQSDIMY